MNRFGTAWVLVWASLWSVGAWAGNAPDLLEKHGKKIQNIEQLSLSSLLGTVSSVSRKTESVLKAPAAVTTLSGEVLRRSGARSLPDLLRAVPGVQVYRNAVGNYVVSLRGTNGLSANNVVVLIDGMQINSPIDGSVDWAAVPVAVEDIEKVEVVRGPVSTIYGADAYTGVIDIVTTGKDESFAGNRLRVYGGGDQHLSSLVGVSGRAGASGKNVTWQLSGIAQYDGTFHRMALSTVTGTEPPLREGGLLGRVAVRTGDHARLVLEGAASMDQKSSLDHLVLESNPATDTQAFATARWELTHLGTVVSGFTAWVRGLYQKESTDVSLYRGLSYAGAEGLRTEAGVDLQLTLPAHLSAQLGGNAGLTRVDAPFINPSANGEVRPGYGFYASLGFDPTDALSFTAAARGDVSEMTGKLQFSYRLSAIYALPTASFRITASSAYRSPTWVEVAGRFIDRSSGLIFLEGTPDLRSPEVNSLEAGAILEPFARFTVTPTIFVEKMDNLLVEDFAPVVRKTFRNEPGSEDLLGGELEARYQLSSNFSLLGTAAVLEWLGTTFTTGSVGVPDQNSTLTVDLRGEGSALDGGLTYGLGVGYASGRQFGTRAGVPPAVIIASLPAEVRVDAAVSYRISHLPWWVFLKGQTFIPNGGAESPLPLSAGLGTTVWAGVAYRR